MFLKKTDKVEDYLSYETGSYVSREEIIRELSLAVRRLQNDTRMRVHNSGVYDVKDILHMLLEYLDLEVRESNTKLVKRHEETK